MSNLQIESFIININNLIQSSDLPVGVVYYILKDKLQEIGVIYNNQLQIEAKQYQEEHVNTKRKDE